MTMTILAPLVVERLALAGRGRRVVRIGMGPRRAARAVARLANTAGTPVIVAGVAGALSGDLEPGDLVVADGVCYGSRTFDVMTPPELVSALRGAGLTVHVGRVFSVPRPALGRAARARRVASGALAVDTESGAVAESLSSTGLIVLRAVVDTPNHPLLRPGTVWRGIAALRSLSRAAPLLAQWGARNVPGGDGPARIDSVYHPEVG